MINDQYFQMEINIMHDDYICQLIDEMDMRGFGVYIGLLIELRRRNDYKCLLNSLKSIARFMNVTEEVLRKVVEDYNLFEIENDYFSSPYLRRVMEPLEKKRQKQSEAGKARVANASRNEYGRFTSSIQPEEKRRVKNRRVEKRRITTATAVEAAVPSWKRNIEEAMNEQNWIELQAANSGLGKNFMVYLQEIRRLFEEHIQIQGAENEIDSLRDAKSYFANFIRQGTSTSKRVAEKLQMLKQERQEEDPYKYETVDPQTGARSYYGVPIPADAPPRPSNDALWDEEMAIWGK